VRTSIAITATISAVSTIVSVKEPPDTGFLEPTAGKRTEMA